MKLDEFLTSGRMTVDDLRVQIGAGKTDGLIRQWRKGSRVPGPRYCIAIEQATGKAVMRWDLRPEDWHLLWPEYTKDAAAVSIATVSAASSADLSAVTSSDAGVEE